RRDPSTACRGPRRGACRRRARDERRGRRARRQGCAWLEENTAAPRSGYSEVLLDALDEPRDGLARVAEGDAQSVEEELAGDHQVLKLVAAHQRVELASLAGDHDEAVQIAAVRAEQDRLETVEVARLRLGGEVVERLEQELDRLRLVSGKRPIPSD